MDPDSFGRWFYGWVNRSCGLKWLTVAGQLWVCLASFGWRFRYAVCWLKRLHGCDGVRSDEWEDAVVVPVVLQLVERGECWWTRLRQVVDGCTQFVLRGSPPSEMFLRAVQAFSDGLLRWNEICLGWLSTVDVEAW